MKKIIAVLTALVLAAACVSALAFTGVESDPGMPAVDVSETAFFEAELHRMENDPEEEETPWGETTYTWNYMDDDAAIAAGDTVTLSCELHVPSQIEGFTAEAVNEIKVVFDFGGSLENIEIADAYGCDVNIECDYDAGYCYPLPGYGNVAVEDGAIVIDAHVNTDVQVIVRGTAAASQVVCDYSCTVGQYQIPAHFSCGKLTKSETRGSVAYYVYEKDVMAVQIRGMKFIAVDGVFDHYYVCLNDKDYVRAEDGSSYTQVIDPSVVYTEGARFEALELAYNTFMSFFGFTDDDIHDAMTDGVFLMGCGAERFEDVMTIGAASAPVEPTDEPVEPTDEPVEPTDEPVEPTDEPVEPTDEPTEPTDEPAEPTNAPDEPNPGAPQTGGRSLSNLGVAAIVIGAVAAIAGILVAVISSSKRKNID